MWVRTRYFHYKKIDKNNILTKDFIMNYVESLQDNTLEFSIARVLLTQKIMADVDSDISYWEITNKQKVEDEGTSSADDKQIITIEQKNFPINKLGIEIDNAEKTTTVLSTLSDATQHYQAIAKKRLREYQKTVMFKMQTNTGIEIKAKFLDKMNDENEEHNDASLSSQRGLSVREVKEITSSSLFGLAKTTHIVYGMPLKNFQDLAEKIDREEAEENGETPCGVEVTVTQVERGSFSNLWRPRYTTYKKKI
jgi:hypothetical protein